MRRVISPFLFVLLALAACGDSHSSVNKDNTVVSPEVAGPPTRVSAIEAEDSQKAPSVPPTEKEVAVFINKEVKLPADVKVNEKPVAVLEGKHSVTESQHELEQTVTFPEETVLKQDVQAEGGKAALAGPPSHELFDKLLQQYVSPSGKVNYAGFKKDKAKLAIYLDSLQSNPPQPNWSRGEQMAYWINAYNAYTIKLIVDNYPLSSITKLDGGKTWDVKRIKIGGTSYSLNNIENDILRPQFKDPRIHFAVNCAAKSCPPLLNRAWTAANLESNFEKQAKAFINNAQFNKISAKEVKVSKIFEWYAADFGSLISFLNKYANTKINANAKVSYIEYDWTLNE